MRALAAAALVVAAAGSPAFGSQAPSGGVHLLDVPYLPQSEALCGGAAVAMVMRYWGASGVYAEAFADLVDPEVAGIRGEALLRALHARGWQAVSLAGDRAFVQEQIGAGRPVIALVEDRPGRYHYVVVVGWAGARVVVHDPARAPFRVLDERAFSTAWKPSGYWTLLAVPGTTGEVRKPPAASAAPSRSPQADASPEPCGPLVDEAVRLAGTGDMDGARGALQLAAEACPRSSAPWREIAGVEALRSDWNAAASAARRAIALDPADQHAWRILATGLYVQEDDEGALAAWNHVGEPAIDLVKVTGLERTRYGVVARVMALTPGTVLTIDRLRAAQRRLSELPSAQAARVAYQPGENGRAQVEAVVLERALLPSAPGALAAIALRLVTDRELTVDVASPSGGGELWSATWRWWQHRPRVGLAFSAPAPVGGIWGVDAYAEMQTYDRAGAVTQEHRQNASFHLADWTSRGLRWEIGAGVDRWRGLGRAGSVAFSVDQRFAADRASVSARASAWRGGVKTWTFGAAAEWRSRTRNSGRVMLGRAGVDLTAESAPLALWPGAGTGQGRSALLRAHPLLDGGVISGAMFGRRLAIAGAEWRQWSVTRWKLLRVAPAVFVDAARVSRGYRRDDPRWQIDAGGGLRVTVPGAGVLRVDVGRGLRDGATALSVGWTK